MRAFSFISISALALLWTGCAAVRPTPTEITKSKKYDADYDTAWKATVEAIAEENVTVSTIEKDSGLIVLSPFDYHPTQASEGKCGHLEQIIRRQGRGNIFVTAEEEKKTKVQINTKLSAQIRWGTGSGFAPFEYYWIKTYSNGAIESELFDAIGNRIARKKYDASKKAWIKRKAAEEAKTNEKKVGAQP